MQDAGLDGRRLAGAVQDAGLDGRRLSGAVQDADPDGRRGAGRVIDAGLDGRPILRAARAPRPIPPRRSPPRAVHGATWLAALHATRTLRAGQAV